MMALAFKVISWTALSPKSISFSMWPSAKLPSIFVPSCPVSVDAVAYPRARGQLISAYEMDPAQPPLPTAMNLPFQPDAGIQTSTLMSESVEGFMLAATRQNAGRSLGVISFNDAG